MEEDRIVELLMEIRGDIQVIKRDLGEDYKVLHGNGHDGLITRVERLERAAAARNSNLRLVREWLGWIFAALNIWIAYKMR